MREGGPALTWRDADALFAELRAKADPAEITLATKAGQIAHRALAGVDRGSLIGNRSPVSSGEARMLGAEEIYIAAAPDLERDWRFMRIEGEPALGKRFALRATVAYKGTWVRLVRTLGEPAIGQQASIAFSQAVAQLPSDRGFSRFPVLAGGGLQNDAAA